MTTLLHQASVVPNIADKLLWDVILTELLCRGHLHACANSISSLLRLQEPAHMPDTASRSQAGRDMEQACHSELVQASAHTPLSAAVQLAWHLLRLEINAGEAFPVSQAAGGTHAVP